MIFVVEIQSEAGLAESMGGFESSANYDCKLDLAMELCHAINRNCLLADNSGF